MGKIFDLEAYGKKARQAVSEGIVLLENEGEILPFKPEVKVAVFGRNQFNYYKSGTGSGGLVNTKHIVGILEALEQEKSIYINQKVKKQYEDWLVEHPFDMGIGWAAEPWYQEEMPLSLEFVKGARDESDYAVVMIGRTAGEDKDNKAEEGSYYLAQEERNMLEVVCKCFEHTVVILNVGNIIDMKWVDEYHPKAVLYVWQGGQEGGRGTADVLMGRVSPSGKLTDTIARNIEDYPAAKNYGDESCNRYEEDIYVGYRYFETFAKEKVKYPFGFGLSYTTFDVETVKMIEEKDTINFHVKVTNTGDCPGKEVLQVYCEAPQGKLGKPLRVLCGFAKTKSLQPKESVELTISCLKYYLASYDDGGLTGHKSCYVLEEGEYNFYLGTDVRNADSAGNFHINNTVVLEQLEEAMAPTVSFGRIKPEVQNGECRISYEDVPLRIMNIKERMEKRRPTELPFTGNKEIKLWDVLDGKNSMDEFIAQLSDEDLCCIVQGEGMCSPKVTPGTAGAFGGVTQELLSFRIPTGCCADGPSGIRMDGGTIAFSLPNGTCLASTFNEELINELYEFEGLELRKNHIDTLLGPGINIHRYPLNGRNFEYFSEDPLLTGKMAAAQLKGMHKYNVTGTIKHFACNSQEFKRDCVEALVSERALREVYLKGFEIAVKEGSAYSIMTSYNPINGFWSASNYDMLTTILRGEWKYSGLVMTDWWAKGNEEGELGVLANLSTMVKSQNDLFMVTENAKDNPNCKKLMEELQNGAITRAELQRCAANVCRVLMKMPALLRLRGLKDELEEQLASYIVEEGLSEELFYVDTSEETALDVSLFPKEKGKSTKFQITAKEVGNYKLELIMKSKDENALAQIPISIFLDDKLVKTITLTGKNKEFNKETVDLGYIWKKNFYLKFYLGQSGIEIGECKLLMY